MKNLLVLLGSMMMVMLLGCGWLSIEMRHPMIFRLLDQYEEEVRWQERERSIQEGLRRHDEIRRAVEHNKRVFDQTAHLP